jgi:glycosyltransferase involved in cell wall biosynthesis
MNAMATGLPVIGARVRALPEYINASCGVIVDIGDSAGLSREIVKFCNDPEYAKKLGEGGKIAVGRFSPFAIAEIWETIYNDAICKHRASV